MKVYIIFEHDEIKHVLANYKDARTMVKEHNSKVLEDATKEFDRRWKTGNVCLHGYPRSRRHTKDVKVKARKHYIAWRYDLDKYTMKGYTIL